ncbi:MAG TPA: tyrosinase family protein [Solirubrobacterales bacterium]|nr:tyrosinase family protein [Solirubrobacterales bacterium]
MPRIRRSLTELQAEYENGDKKPLEDLMRAWKGIKELRSDDPRSFFVLGGYHGEPFRGAGWGIGEPLFWGGYCHHGNVLFPVWHRAYLYALEEALRSVPGCEEVTIPFWDECSEDSLKHGIPWSLTVEKFTLDGEEIDNPLRSYVFPTGIVDHISSDNPNYSKEKGYETVRYPYSGLVGSEKEREETAKHNAQWDYPEAVKLLDQNIVAWLNQKIVIGGETISTGVHQAFVDCLGAPNYTVFSNTTSAKEWNDAGPPVVPLESPHNKVHLAVGGFDVPNYHASVIPGANGDMGENDTAALDPIFYFHHCFIDRAFWLWQERHGATDELSVVERYPGTNSADSQGATPGIAPNSWLSMDTPLDPFAWAVDGEVRKVTGRDVFNIETQLGYSYGPGSLEEAADAAPERFEAADGGQPKLHVTGIDRSNIRGSFLIVASAEVDGETQTIGSEAVLSRWHVSGCANCQTHLLAGASFPLQGLHEQLDPEAYQVEVRTRDGLLGDRPQRLSLLEEEEPRPFRVEVR